MKKNLIKLIAIIFVIGLFTINVQAFNISQKVLNIKSIEDCNIKSKEIDKEILFLSTSPNVNRITDFEIISGNDTDIEKIESLLNNEGPRNYFYTEIKVSNLSFSITYKKTPLRRGCLYWCQYINSSYVSDGEGFFCRPHTVNVTGLSGAFYYAKFTLYRPIFGFLIPPRFDIGGYCESVEFVE